MITLTKTQLALCNQLAMGPAGFVVIDPFPEVQELHDAGVIQLFQYDTHVWWASLTPNGRLMFQDAGLRREN